jgi:SAM-dependent methyltransferase
MQTTIDKPTQPLPPTDYFLDNKGRHAEERYRALSELYDARTIHYIKGLGIEEGWSCLEVGGGGGSIASWLCNQVGDSGRVLATEIDPGFLRALPFSNLEVRCHDIQRDELPEQQFDLAHTRLVLLHLREREMALEKMITSLKPGGWLVLEEFDSLSIVPDPAVNPGEEVLKIRVAFERLLTARGVDLRYGRLLPQRLRAHGLVNVGAEASLTMWGAATSMLKLNFEELRDPILQAGLMSQAEFEAEMKRVDEDDFLMPSPMMWTVWGQVPEPSSNGFSSNTGRSRQEGSAHG